MTALLPPSTLQEHPFLRHAGAPFLNTLAQFQKNVEFAPGHIILRENHYAVCLFLILEGEVLVECANLEQPVDTLGPGEVLGWSWLYPPYLSHFTARARTTVRALEFNGPSLLIRAEEDHHFGYELMKRIAACGIRRLNSMRQVLAKDRTKN